MSCCRRAFLYLRRQLLSPLKSNPPISGSSSFFYHHSNPNSTPFSFSPSSFRRDRLHHRLELKSLISCNSPPLIPYWSFKSNFNGIRSFATRLAESSSKPPKETIMLAGCDWEHWLVVVEAPDPELTRDEIIDGYIKTLAYVVGSEEEARMKLYSVSTRHYYAFGALLSEETAYKLKDQPHVRWVLPDSYLDVKNKTYAGEPFINGQAVPYDPKYHEIWVRNREASLRSNTKNKRRQRDPNSSHQRSRSPSASFSGSPNENWMPSAGSENQGPQMSNVQSQKPGHTSVSVPSVYQQNELPPGHPTNQTPQTSQMPNPVPPTFLQNQAPQYSQKQDQFSPWAQPPHGPHERSSTMDPNHLSRSNQNLNLTPVVGSQNLSQIQNPASEAFSGSPAPHYSQMQSHSSPWTSSPPMPSATMDSDHQNWTPSPAHPLPSIDSNYQSWGKQNQNWTPALNSHNQVGHLSRSDFSQSHASEYSQIQTHSSQRTALPSEPSAVMYQNRHQWSNHRTGSQSQVGHPSQTEKPPTPAFSQSQAPQYSQTQNYSSPWAPTPQPEPSARLDPNHQGWSNQQGSENHSKQPYQWQNQRHPPSPGSYTSGRDNPSWSQEPAPQYRSLSPQPTVSPHHFSYDNMPLSAPPRAMPSDMQSPDIQRGSIQAQVQHNGYSFRDIPHCAQSGTSQNGHPSNTSQHHSFQDLQSSNATASSQGWNNHNITPSMQSSHTGPRIQNHQFQSEGAGRPIQNNNSHYKIGQANLRVDNYYRGRMPSDSDTGNMQTRECQERDMPVGEEYVYGPK